MGGALFRLLNYDVQRAVADQGTAEDYEVTPILFTFEPHAPSCTRLLLQVREGVVICL